MFGTGYKTLTGLMKYFVITPISELLETVHTLSVEAFLTLRTLTPLGK